MLAQLARAGFRVPDAFVITTRAYERFLESQDLARLIRMDLGRKLGMPCVNGIPNAVELLEDGEMVTVDGYLGIVTVGPPEFDLEAAYDGTVGHAAGRGQSAS